MAEPSDGDPRFTPASSPFPSSSGESGREHLHIPALSPVRGTTCLQTQPGNTRQQTQADISFLRQGPGYSLATHLFLQLIHVNFWILLKKMIMGKL